jgi:hypothetical protein
MRRTGAGGSMGNEGKFAGRVPHRFVRAWAALLAAPLLLSVLAPCARADVHALPRSVAEEVLSESVPTAFAPDDFAVEDYLLEWSGPSPAGVEAQLVPGSLEWVRGALVLLVPRARLRISLPAASGLTGRVGHARFHQPLAREGDRLVAEIPVALISGPRNPIRLALRAADGERLFTLQLRFRPRAALAARARVYLDASCSPYALEIEASRGAPADSWLFLGCRLVHGYGGEGKAVPSLEVFAFWDHVGERIELAGAPLEPAAESTWALRLRAEPGEFTLRSGEYDVRVRYRIPERVRLLSLSAGIGPYDYSFRTPSGQTRGIVPLLTIYGSYFVTETIRFVFFDATPIASRTYTDVGVYVNAEQFRSLDRRLSLSLMLGAHAFAFGSRQGLQMQFAAPQGFEFQFRDFLLPAWNAAAGAFLYPEISGRSYSNVWLRYGKRAYFVELNYLAFREPTLAGAFSSRSLGLSFGFPLARLL